MSSSATPAGIEAADLRKSFHGTCVLDLPYFRVAPATTLALIGPSGCGKSTLLRVLTGLVSADTGRIRIAGLAMEPVTLRQIRRRTGYMIQDGGLFPHLSVRDNVAIVARDLGFEKERISGRIEELLTLVQIPAALLSRYPAQLSGGQRQRVALMRALMLDPEVLLMDEALVALDPMVRSDLQQELRQLFERLRKTVLFVTHDMAEAAFIGSEIAIMQAGRIIQRGSLEEITSDPADPFVLDFIRAQRSWRTLVPAAE